MANFLLVPAIAITFSYSASAQTKDGGISTEMLQMIVKHRKHPILAVFHNNKQPLYVW